MLGRMKEVRMGSRAHWENVYGSKAPSQVSWYQPHAEKSLDLIRRTGIGRPDPIIDVGGGASTLVDDLVAAGYDNVTVLDIAPSALRLARERLGAAGERVRWIEADVTQAVLLEAAYSVWHDRAVFHFLTEPAARRAYVTQVRRSVRQGGHVIVATFAEDGPERCSGLQVSRYRPADLHAEFGPAFRLVESVRETHHTPAGAEQRFVYCYCRLE
jgi:ubiquinone/menaquinone biosynthesis C-methylase UbiE